MTFEKLGLSPDILKALDSKSYSHPTPIQEKAIPIIMGGKDVLASAQTGTGKTAGFTLPILQKLSEHKLQGKKSIQALILTPTRELAAQIEENINDYSAYLNIESAVIFGGVSQGPQVNKLKRGIDVLTATPGRLLDLHQQGHIDLRQIKFFVLDEADRMLDMGFARDLKKILALLPKRRQNLLFSATFSIEIKRLANDFLHDPKLIEAQPENTTVEKIQQKAYLLDGKRKTEFITKLISEGEWNQVLVFTRTKHGANRLCKKLERQKITCAPIHGNKSQGARTKALADFKSGAIRVLVATDIAARGLDIPLLPHVINYELPNVPADYVHRIGRTGRAGQSGTAISLVSKDEIKYLRDIEKLLQEQIPSKVPKGFEPLSNEEKQQSSTQGKNTSGNKPQGNKQRNSKKRNWSSKKKKKKKTNSSSDQSRSSNSKPAKKRRRW